MASPYERIKTAWESENRPTALNRVVEVMAAEGITRAALDEGLDQLLMEIRAGGADDDTEEIIMSVGDRLHGWCHPTAHIHTVDSEPATTYPPIGSNGVSTLPSADAPTGR